jgi:hypothetical protein
MSSEEEQGIPYEVDAQCGQCSQSKTVKMHFVSLPFCGAFEMTFSQSAKLGGKGEGQGQYICTNCAEKNVVELDAEQFKRIIAESKRKKRACCCFVCFLPLCCTAGRMGSMVDGNG